MKKSAYLKALILAILFSGILQCEVHAWTNMIKGKPNIIPGKDEGVFYWLDEDGFHLRFTGPKKAYEFKGILETEKPMKITKKIGIQNTDSIKFKDNKSMNFLIKTSKNQIKGFDFKTDSKYMSFAIGMNGQRVMRKNFLAGKNKIPFEHTPFRIYDIVPGQKTMPPGIFK